MDRTYTIAEGVCQSWEAVVVEEGGERVCSTRLANWTHPDTDDWSITRHDPRASLQHNVEDTRCDQHTLAFSVHCIYLHFALLDEQIRELQSPGGMTVTFQLMQAHF